jgi:hypothetical protein
VHTLCEDEDQADSGEAEAFLSNVQRLFPGVDKRLFRSKAVDFGALSLEELVSRVKTDEESEAPKALAMEVASRPASAARLRDLLAEASPEPRIRALKIALLVQCEETEYEALGLLQHPSAAVREALVREIVSCLGCSGRHEKEKRLLAAIAADEREETRIREMASSALGI